MTTSCEIQKLLQKRDREDVGLEMVYTVPCKRWRIVKLGIEYNVDPITRYFYAKSQLLLRYEPAGDVVEGHMTLCRGIDRESIKSPHELSFLQCRVGDWWYDFFAKGAFREGAVVNRRVLLFIEDSFAESWHQFGTAVATIFRLPQHELPERPHFSVDSVQFQPGSFLFECARGGL
jgi:hypothetical protein